MGLCKCPKRKVTNLFCFEHRVNVCESCLVANHESCVVQTYLSWLTDSDYDPNCLLCSEPFPAKENVRLKCFHVFHWACLNARFAQLPNTTAPAGYKCPSCLDTIFPASNQTSPVIDQLRQKLETVNWARNGLGLPTLPELDSNSVVVNNYKARPEAYAMKSSPTENHRSNRGSFSVNIEEQNTEPHTDPFEVNTFTDRTKLLGDQNSVKHHSRNAYPAEQLANEDFGDSKYAKKTSERGMRLKFARLPRSVKRVLLGLLVLSLLYLLISNFGGSRGGSSSLSEDPMFDPHANPHIRIEQKTD